MLFVEMNRETVRFDDNHLEKALKVLRNGGGDGDNGEKVQFFLEVCEFQLYSTIGIYRASHVSQRYYYCIRWHAYIVGGYTNSNVPAKPPVSHQQVNPQNYLEFILSNQFLFESFVGANLFT